MHSFPGKKSSLSQHTCFYLMMGVLCYSYEYAVRKSLFFFLRVLLAFLLTFSYFFSLLG